MGSSTSRPSTHASLQPPKFQGLLCPNCQSIPPSVPCHEYHFLFVGAEARPRRKPEWSCCLQPSIEALKQSAADGCPLCALFYRKSLRSRRGNPHDWEHGNCNSQQLRLHHASSRTYVMSMKLGGRYLQSFDFVAASPDWSKRYENFFRTMQNPNLLKFWVKECVTQHGQCASGTGFLPTRLLDLGGPGEDGDTIRVVVSARHEIQDRRYMALSHRWDECTKLARSTLHNIERHEQAVSLATLPPSFRYAACVARQLGLRYLWIDSLCILQDSREDWLKESAQMGQVYGQAFCTIATSNDELEAYDRLHRDQGHGGTIPSSDDSTSGDQESLPQWVQVTLGGALDNDKEGDEQGMRLVRVFDKKPSDWESTLEQAVLSGRGWALQERQLSPRIIHVTSTAILWECHTCRGSDQVPWTDQVEENVSTKARYRIDDKVETRRRMPRGRPDHHYKTWYNLVWDYSNRILTADTDKLPGLAGLARAMAATVEDEYVAGLWKGDIVSGLLWKARRWATSEECERLGVPSYQVRPTPPGFKPSGPNGPMEQTRPARRRAPTWSWMSLDGQVIHRTDHHEQERDGEPVLAPAAVVVDMSLPGSDPDAGANPYTQAAGGLITMTGCLRPAVARHFLRDLKLRGMAPEFWTGGYKTLHGCPGSEASSVSGDDAAARPTSDVTTAVGSHTPSRHSETEQEDCVGCVQYDVVEEMVPDQTVHVLALRRLERKEPWRDTTPECIFTVRDKSGFPIHDQVLGLALVPTGRSPNEYRRVGLAEYVDASWFEGCQRETVTIV